MAHSLSESAPKPGAEPAPQLKSGGSLAAMQALPPRDYIRRTDIQLMERCHYDSACEWYAAAAQFCGLMDGQALLLEQYCRYRGKNLAEWQQRLPSMPYTRKEADRLLAHAREQEDARLHRSLQGSGGE